MTPTARSEAPPASQGGRRPTISRATGLEVRIERTSQPGSALTDKDALWPGRIRRLARATLRSWDLTDFTDSKEPEPSPP
jgi:hypothetical protein